MKLSTGSGIAQGNEDMDEAYEVNDASPVSLNGNWKRSGTIVPHREALIISATTVLGLEPLEVPS